MDNAAIQQAFEAAYQPDPREGLTVRPTHQGADFAIEVRHKDADGTLRGFDVVAQPTQAEGKSAQDVGQEMAQVVGRELGQGQLPARGDDGTFRRIVV